jgi:hypothetical protein
MSYLRSINRAILVSLALLGLSISSANAALFQFQYEDIISLSSIPGLAVGQSVKVTAALDNGGTSNVSQTWTTSDLQSVTWDFNSGGLVTTFNSPWGGSLGGTSGNFATDGTGTLTSVMNSWWDSSVGSDFLTSGPGTPSNWFLTGYNCVYRDTIGSICLQNVTSMLTASNWTPYVSAVPVPAAVWLFGTGILGLIGFSKRKSRVAA